jgi:hypothetical protein
MVAFEKPTGEGEVSEQVVGTGIRHALGELMTCRSASPSGRQPDWWQAGSSPHALPTA